MHVDSKLGKVHPRVMNYTNFVESESQMLKKVPSFKIIGLGSGGDYFWLLTLCVHGNHPGTWIIYINLSSLFPEAPHEK